MTKTCSRCNTEKDFTEFNKHPTGSLGLQAWCKQCYRDSISLRIRTDREWAIQRNKRRYHRRKLLPDFKSKRAAARIAKRIKAKQLRFDYLQQHGPCVKCGSSLDLQFDHIKPHGLGGKFKQTPSQDMWMWGVQRRLDELAKCQILCRKCHQIKSGLECRKYEHGLNLYERHGCRCEICRAASAKQKRQERARAKLRKSSQNQAL